MLADDPSLSRRVKDLETQVAELRRELSGARQLPPAPVAPRERWLGRTTSDSPGNYPTSGDTFEVEPISAYFTATPGTRAITETGRGRKVVARTRPATYLPRGTEVEVWRSRGHGPLGAGEWWIGLPPANPDLRTWHGEAIYGLDSGGVTRNSFAPTAHPDVPGTTLELFPDVLTNWPPETANILEAQAPQRGVPAIIARTGCVLYYSWELAWQFPSIDQGQHNWLYYSYYGRPGLLGMGVGGGPPPWTTRMSFPTVSEDHYHRVDMYIPTAEHFTARVLTTYGAAGGDVQRVSYGSLPVAHLPDRGSRHGTICGNGVALLGAGYGLSFAIDGYNSFSLSAGGWSPDLYPGRLSQFRLWLAWVGAY